jgi:hypothetical protein
MDELGKRIIADEARIEELLREADDFNQRAAANRREAKEIKRLLEQARCS